MHTLGCLVGSCDRCIRWGAAADVWGAVADPYSGILVGELRLMYGELWLMLAGELMLAGSIDFAHCLWGRTNSEATPFH